MPSPFVVTPFASVTPTARCFDALVFIVGLDDPCVEPDLDVSDFVVAEIVASLVQSANRASLILAGRLLFFAGRGAENEGILVT
jgi:hypothetical protein